MCHRCIQRCVNLKEVWKELRLSPRITLASHIFGFQERLSRPHAICRLGTGSINDTVYIGRSPSNNLKLQSILNPAVSFIGGIPKCPHISVFIRDSLHWLLTQQRILFKTLSIMRNCLVGMAANLRSFCRPTRASSLPARASSDRPVVVFWVFHVCALLLPIPTAFPTFVLLTF